VKRLLFSSLVVCFYALCLSSCASTQVVNKQQTDKPHSDATKKPKTELVNSESYLFSPLQEVQDYSVKRTGNLADPIAQEVSGMAVSNQNSDRLWMINDSGNSAEIMAFDKLGKRVTSFATTLTNRDWESLSSFSIGDKNYLLVADTGDNLRAHPHYTVSLFLEPDNAMVLHSIRVGKAAKRVLEPIVTMRFIYPDGKHNSEAVAVSAVDRKIIIVAKAANNPGIYSIPLRLKPNTWEENEIITATHLGTLSAPAQSMGDRLIGQISGVNLSQATGLEISAEGNAAFMLTYRGIYGWIRQSLEQPWGEILSQPAKLISRHSLAQAEAIALSKNTAKLYVVSENLPSPILELTPTPVEGTKPAGLL